MVVRDKQIDVIGFIVQALIINIRLGRKRLGSYKQVR
jgi:hypothetical protein